jgi:hypothetical protein
MFVPDPETHRIKPHHVSTQLPMPTSLKRGKPSLDLNTDTKRTKEKENVVYSVDDVHGPLNMSPSPELSPLTPIGLLEEETTLYRDGSKWCREEKNNWLLENEPENALEGPEWKGMFHYCINARYS